MSPDALQNVPANARQGLIVANADKPLAHVTDREAFTKEIIERYIDGAEIKDMAAEHRVSTVRLYQLLTEHNVEGWRSAQAAKALSRFEDAREALGEAKDGLSLARAREELKAAQWELEKLFRRLYGDKVEIDVKGHVTHSLIAVLADLPSENAAQQPPIIEGEIVK